MPTPRTLRCSISFIGLFILGWVAVSHGKHEQREEELIRVEHELKSKRDKARTLAQHREDLHKKIEAIKTDLVSVASTSRHYEERISNTEKTLASLGLQEKKHTTEWHQNQNTWGRVMIMLHHLSKASPTGFFLTQKDPHRVVQSTLALKSVVPYLQSMTDHLKTELDNLKSLRQAMADERMMLAQATDSLAKKRSSLQKLLQQKSDLEQANLGEQDVLERRIRLLGAQAENLRDLLSELEAEEAVGVYKKQGRSKTHRLAQKLASKLRLIAPVHGHIITRFRKKASNHDQELGLVYETQPGAQVVSPARGQVVFAGPFRSYKRIIIIDHGRSFHSLFAGISDIIIPVGQEVLSGQPIGVMPISNPQNKKRLYMELRQDGEPIDPEPWLVKP